MARETLSARSARVVLNNGTDGDGNPMTKNMTISGISGNSEDWDAAKYIAIVAALEPVLSKTIVGAQTIATFDVTAN